MERITLQPIGVFHSESVHPYEAPRQPRPDDERLGEIRLNEGHNFEQALTGLAEFERIWVIFQFHHNTNWKPMVRPPRGENQKIGVFATRAPYRPNQIGMSCVRLVSVQGRKLIVKGADLLDGTPIFDIKPYVPESDAFTDSRVGWLENVTERQYEIVWSPKAAEQIEFLALKGVTQLKDFLIQQLQYEPFDDDRKRVTKGEQTHTLAYRTWRAEFEELSSGKIQVTQILSGYSDQDLMDATDKWNDKQIHRDFKKRP